MDAVGGENHRRLEAAASYLHASRDQDGQPFRILRVPMPKTIVVEMEPGDSVYEQISSMNYSEAHPFPLGKGVKVIAAASYLNFVITPKVILVPAYGSIHNDPEQYKRDEQVVEVLSGVFPDRTMVKINALSINLGGGGMHCITLHQPRWPHK
jgi:agmatine deiminase